MLTTYLKAGSPFRIPTDEWVLIFGGVTRSGNRGARRLIAKALKKGITVVWFDGFEERFDKTGARVPLDEGGGDSNVLVIEFATAERRTSSGRLRTGEGLTGNPLTRSIWRVFLRRMGTVLRPRAGWKSIAADVKQLAGGPAPQIILYCDEFAITSAWYAGRIWPAVPVASDLTKKTP